MASLTRANLSVASQKSRDMLPSQIHKCLYLYHVLPPAGSLQIIIPLTDSATTQDYYSIMGDVIVHTIGNALDCCGSVPGFDSCL